MLDKKYLQDVIDTDSRTVVMEVDIRCVVCKY